MIKSFVVVGFGHIGRRHATIINSYPSCKLIGIVDVNKWVQEHELFPVGVPFFEDINDCLQSLKPDVCVIATPNGLHASLAITALNAGCHVVIEKPMALSKMECEEVIFTSLKVSKHVFVVKQNRYSPPSFWLKEIVEKGILGSIYMVQINCYWNRDDRYYGPSDWKGSLHLDGGTLFTQFSHFIDILYWIFGDITDIKAEFANFNHHESIEFEDSGVVNFKFVKGGIGSLNFSTAIWDSNLESSITVVGENGSVKVGGQYMNEVEHCNIKYYQMPELPPTNAPNDYGPFKGSAANHHYVIENVVNTLNGIDTITANGLEGMKVVDIIERIYAVARRK